MFDILICSIGLVSDFVKKIVKMIGRGNVNKETNL